VNIVAPASIRFASSLLIAGFAACATSAAISIWTWSPASAQDSVLPDKPFAEHRLVLQLSDDDRWC
jgi:hypothetical protein